MSSLHRLVLTISGVGLLVGCDLEAGVGLTVGLLVGLNTVGVNGLLFVVGRVDGVRTVHLESLCWASRKKSFDGFSDSGLTNEPGKTTRQTSFVNNQPAVCAAKTSLGISQTCQGRKDEKDKGKGSSFCAGWPKASPGCD